MDGTGRGLSVNMQAVWKRRLIGDGDMRAAYFRDFGKEKYFSQNYLYTDKTPGTQTAKEDCFVLFDHPKYTSKKEVCCIGTFPQDYNFLKTKPHYLIGMSVPPVMMAKITEQIYNQWLSKINERN